MRCESIAPHALMPAVSFVFVCASLPICQLSYLPCSAKVGVLSVSAITSAKMHAAGSAVLAATHAAGSVEFIALATHRISEP